MVELSEVFSSSFSMYDYATKNKKQGFCLL